MKQKYTVKTKLYPKNNKEIIEYYEEIIKKYNFIFREVFHKINTKEKINIDNLDKEIRAKYNILKRTSMSIIIMAQSRYESIKGLKEFELKRLNIKIETLESKLEEENEKLTLLKEKARNNELENVEDYRNLKKKVAFLKIKIDKTKGKINKVSKELENGKFKITFGTKKIMKQDLEKFMLQRDKSIWIVGSKTDNGCNSNLQLKYKRKINQFEIQLRKDFEYKDIEPVEKGYAKGKCFFYNHKQELKKILENKNSPLTYRISKEDGKYYLSCTFEIQKDKQNFITRKKYGTIGLDFNKGLVAVSEINQYGHLVKTKNIKYRYGQGNKTKNDLEQIVNIVTKQAIEEGKDIVVEDLNFVKTKSKTAKAKGKKRKKYNKMIHSFRYREFVKIFENICFRKGVTLKKVNPAWTSWIAEQKFCKKMKLNIHNGASFVIARKGMGIRDKV